MQTSIIIRVYLKPGGNKKWYINAHTSQILYMVHINIKMCFME